MLYDEDGNPYVEPPQNEYNDLVTLARMKAKTIGGERNRYNK